jgi:hypothetical protein
VLRILPAIPGSGGSLYQQQCLQRQPVQPLPKCESLTLRDVCGTVPEVGTWPVLAGVGLLAFGLWRRRTT